MVGGFGLTVLLGFVIRLILVVLVFLWDFVLGGGFSKFS